MKPCIVRHHVLYKVYFKIHHPLLIIVIDSTAITLSWVYAMAWFACKILTVELILKNSGFGFEIHPQG